MHGNPPVRNHSGLNDGSAVWLGLPAAREHFDPSVLAETDRSRLAAAHGARRRADFEVSRALLAFTGAGTAAYSLSHGAEHAALFIGPAGCKTGVDLEINRPRDVLRLARFAFHEREAGALEAALEEARPRLFYTLWTLKEAFAKALQIDLVDALRECVFWNEGGKWRGQIPTQAAWSGTVFQPRPQLFLAAACVGAEQVAETEQWEWPPKRRGEWPVIACASARATADVVQD